MSLQPKAKPFMVDVCRIGPGKITFGKTEVMHRVQEVGFPNAVSTADPNYPFRKPVGLMEVIFKLKD
jgi:hypothetical protein